MGDIDPDYIEAQIKAIFGPIKMPENPQPREFVQVQDTPGTIYAIGKDKEQTTSTIMFMFKQKEQLLPKQMRGTFVYYPVTYLTEAITTMLNHRLADIAATPDATFAYANVEIGNFFLSKTKDALTLYVIAKGNDTCKAFGDAYRELLRAVRGGFTVSEYDRARTEILSQYEKQYDQRGARENTSYCREYAQNFTTGDPIPGIEFEYKTMQMIAQMITLEQINSLLPEGKKVLVVNNGAYSTRAVEICQYYCLPHIDLKFPVDQRPDLTVVEETLKANPDIALVHTTHNETGTGILNPIREIGALAHKYGAIFTVDTTSTYAMRPINVHEDNVDFCMASAQKGLMAFTGLSFIVGRKDIIEASKNYPKRSYYCNLYMQYDFFERTGEMHFTPPVQTIYATIQALKEYWAEGEEAKWARHTRVFNAINEGLDELGFRQVIKPEW